MRKTARLSYGFDSIKAVFGSEIFMKIDSTRAFFIGNFGCSF